MYLGLDLGTSGLRGLLVAANGTVVGIAEAHYPVSHDNIGWSEQDPINWLHAVDNVMRTLGAAHPGDMARLRGIGLSGHMHGATLLDHDGAVLRPCILWNDTRSHEQAARLDNLPVMRAISGNIVFPGFTAPKLVWVAENEPDIFARVTKVLLPKDYVNFHLTGRYVSEMSDAAGTSWLDVAARDWSDDLLAATGMRRDQMPDLVEGSAPVGPLRADLAAQWGVPDDVIVVGGGADNAAAACGVGTLAQGDGFVSLGTSGVLLAGRNSFAPKPESAVHTFCHAIPGHWYQMGVILAATDCLNWLAGILGEKVADLVATLGTTPGGPTNLIFLPYLSGERTPHNDGQIRGAFLNLDIGTSRAQMVQAVLQGVAFALRDNLVALQSTGAQLHRLIAIGGGAQSAYWVQMLADVLGIDIDLPAKGEFGAALGAARLAICGVTGADPAKIMTKPDIARSVAPNPEFATDYAVAYTKWRAAYPAIKALK